MKLEFICGYFTPLPMKCKGYEIVLRVFKTNLAFTFICKFNKCVGLTMPQTCMNHQLTMGNGDGLFSFRVP